jgi:hypothetical protein
MKVFQIRPVMPTKAGGQKRAMRLGCKSSESQFLAGERFRGHPFPADWKKVELNFVDQALWDADFYFYGPGALVCSDRAMEALAPLEDEGEFLPVGLKGRRGSYFLYNSTNCRSYLNSKRTIWEPSDLAKEGRQIRKHVFWAERIGDDCLFKLLDEGAVHMYCLERTGDPYDGEFKALVEANELTGLSFLKVWSGGR